MNEIESRVIVKGPKWLLYLNSYRCYKRWILTAAKKKIHSAQQHIAAVSVVQAVVRLSDRHSNSTRAWCQTAGANRRGGRHRQTNGARACAPARITRWAPGHLRPCVQDGRHPTNGPASSAVVDHAQAFGDSSNSPRLQQGLPASLL
jgi:hypothetical protein